MNIKKVIMITGIVLIVLALGLIFRLDETSRVAPSRAAQVEPQPTVQATQTEVEPTLPQTQPSSPIAEKTTNFVPSHELITKPGDVSPQPMKMADLPQNTAATVNDVPITKTQLEEELNRLIISPSSHGGIKTTKKDELRKLALEELVARELAYQEAKKMGLKVSNTEIVTSLIRIKRRYKTDRAFKEALQAEKITQEDLEQRIQKDLLLKKINQVEIENRARVSETEAKQHYEANKAKFVTPVSLRLWNIVVKVEAGKETEARQKIEKAYQMLREGKDFSSVAYTYSDDDFRIMGGDYGWIHRGQLSGGLEKVAFNTKENEITEPFQTEFGWQIIKVSGIRPEKQLKYEEVKEKIKEGLYKQRIRQVRIDFVNRLKNSADIKYNSNS